MIIDLIKKSLYCRKGTFSTKDLHPQFTKYFGGHVEMISTTEWLTQKNKNHIQLISLSEGFLSVWPRCMLVAFEALHTPSCLHVAFSTIRHEMT